MALMADGYRGHRNGQVDKPFGGNAPFREQARDQFLAQDVELGTIADAERDSHLLERELSLPQWRAAISTRRSASLAS